MSRRPFLPLLMLLALLVSPSGRMAAAEAAAMPPHATATALAGHCPDMPASDAPSTERGKAIDCLIACAAMAPATAPKLTAQALSASAPEAIPLQAFAGVQPEAEPPPPRRA